MPNQARLGLWPVDANRYKPRKYCLASGFTLQNGNLGVAPGEVVKANGSNTVLTLEAGDGTNVILGVVASVTYKDTNGVRVYGGYVPAGTTYTGDPDVLNPNAIYVWVFDQPDIEYIAPLANASATSLTNFQAGMKNVNLTATTATTTDTIFKHSTRALDLSSVSAATKQFRVLDILRSPSQDYGSTNLRVKCMINQGVNAFFTPTGV